MKKKLGQNFLIDKNIAQKEIDYANITKDDIVLEIGPGNGILTKLLAEKAKKVIAIEIDEKLVDNLKNFIPDNVDLIHEDALKVDFGSLPKFNKIVSNLPFQISSPITFKFLEHNFDLAVLIYQKEFADRMVATVGSKDYSRLSVGVFYKTKCEIIDIVPKTFFKPQPKVDSGIVRLIPRKKPPFEVADEEFFLDLVKKLFNHRRKKIKTVLKKHYAPNIDDLPYLECRVENLSPQEIANLSNILYKIQ